MSARSSSASTPSSSSRSLPDGAASWRPGPPSGWPRSSRSTPRARRFLAASSPILPAPTSRTERFSRSSKTRAASSAASGGDGCRVLADARLAAHALADVQRLAEQPVQDRTDGARVLGRLVRALHLTQDLRLAGNEGVQPCGDAEEVMRGFAVLLHVEQALEVRTRHARESDELVGRRGPRGLEVLRGDVEADSVARG